MANESLVQKSTQIFVTFITALQRREGRLDQSMLLMAASSRRRCARRQWAARMAVDRIAHLLTRRSLAQLVDAHQNGSLVIFVLDSHVLQIRLIVINIFQKFIHLDTLPMTLSHRLSCATQKFVLEPVTSYVYRWTRGAERGIDDGL